LSSFSFHWRHQIHRDFSFLAVQFGILSSEVLPRQFHFTTSVPIFRLYRVFYTFCPDFSFIQGVLHVLSRLFIYTGCSTPVTIIRLYRMFYTFCPDYSFIQGVLQLLSRLFVYTGCSTLFVPIIHLYRVFYNFCPDYSFIRGVYTGCSSCACARQPYRLEGLLPPGHSLRASALGKPGHCALQHVCMFQISRRPASVCINHCRRISACPVQARKAFAEDCPIHLLCIVLSIWQGSQSTALHPQRNLFQKKDLSDMM
jgi:hypothetical protein